MKTRICKSCGKIIKQHGFVQVFDSGTITWKWTNKENANDR